VPLAIGSCSSVPYPACTRCHSCASVQPKHTGVQGFQLCGDQRCYECHPRGTASDGGGARGLRKVKR
jgi:hypothetical protein